MFDLSVQSNKEIEQTIAYLGMFVVISLFPLEVVDRVRSLGAKSL